MDDEMQKKLQDAGWTPKLMEIAKASLIPSEVDRMFLDGAKDALRKAGFGALEFLSLNPGASIRQLAVQLNRGVSEIGLVMAIYNEATANGKLRAIAKELLIRKIREEFPGGWSTAGVGSAVRIGSWDRDIRTRVDDPNIAGYATRIINHLTVTDPPPDRWLPQYPVDPLIDRLFDKYWPTGSMEPHAK